MEDRGSYALSPRTTRPDATFGLVAGPHTLQFFRCVGSTCAGLCTCADRLASEELHGPEDQPPAAAAVGAAAADEDQQEDRTKRSAHA